MTEIYGQKYINETINIELLKNSYATVVEKKNIIFGGKKISRMIALMGLKKEDGSVDKNALSIYFTLENGLYYIIETEAFSSEKKAINSALALFIKNLKTKKDLQLLSNVQYTSLAGSFDIIAGMNLVTSINTNQFIFDVDIPQQWSIQITRGYDGEWKNAMNTYTFEEMGSLILKSANLEKSDAVTSTEIKKNSQGAYYLDFVVTGKEGISYVDIFYTKVDNIIYTTYVKFKLPKSNAELDKKYYEFLDTINPSGELPFKSATIWKVTIKNSGDTSGSGSMTP